MNTSYEEIALRLSGQFKIDVDDYFVRTHSIQALNEMGLIETEEHLVFGTVKNQCLSLGKRYSRINWVVRDDFKPTTSISLLVQNIWFPPQTVFKPIPNEDLLAVYVTQNLKINYIPRIKGPYLPYKVDKGCLHFNETDINVVVFAETVKLEEGLPPIPADALEACVYYCMYVWYQPLFTMGKIAVPIWREISSWVDNRFAQCQNRIGFKQLNQNEMSDVQSIAVSMDRKAYGIDS